MINESKKSQGKLENTYMNENEKCNIPKHWVTVKAGLGEIYSY